MKVRLSDWNIQKAVAEWYFFSLEWVRIPVLNSPNFSRGEGFVPSELDLVSIIYLPADILYIPHEPNTFELNCVFLSYWTWLVVNNVPLTSQLAINFRYTSSETGVKSSKGVLNRRESERLRNPSDAVISFREPTEGIVVVMTISAGVGGGYTLSNSLWEAGLAWNCTFEWEYTLAGPTPGQYFVNTCVRIYLKHKPLSNHWVAHIEMGTGVFCNLKNHTRGTSIDANFSHCNGVHKWPGSNSMEAWYLGECEYNKTVKLRANKVYCAT